jgi:phosphoribosylamine--glycine ligase
LSCFVLIDGKGLQNTSNSKDYKRIGEGDTGLNTGGMGAVSPVPYVDAVLMDKIEHASLNLQLKTPEDGFHTKALCFIGLN